METDNKTSKIHPLTAAAAIALILVCLVGIAAMIGILPNFKKDATPTPPATELTAGKTAPMAANTPANSTPAVEVPAAPPAKVVHKKPVPKPVYKEPRETASNYPSDYAPKYPSDYAPKPVAPPPCPSCGVVESVRAIEEQPPATGIGAGVGALLGGVLGHQVGSGNGRTLATVAGAVGGGLAGNAIEKKRNTTTSYEVIVRMEDGSRQRFMMNEQRWRSGDLVRVDNGNLISRNQ